LWRACPAEGSVRKSNGGGPVNRVLAVVGSPRRKGNTHLLVERLLEGVETEGGVGEMLFLADLTIKECNGCHGCWKTGRCSKKDDMSRVYERIEESDAIVFGTPVYWYGPTALMKGFVDRFVYFNCPENRHGTRGKKAALVVPFEEDDLKTSAPLVDFFQRSLGYLEMDLVGQILVPGVTLKGEVRRKTGPMEEAFELGRRLGKGPTL
jgi:multimeric flavodoxin WrbA